MFFIFLMIFNGLLNFKKYYFLLLFILPLIISTQDEVYICGNEKCTQKGSYCSKNIDNNYYCECYKEYATFPLNSEIKCNYKRKKQIKAFLLELFVTYGSAHFYTGNYKYAIPKLIVFVTLYCLYVGLRAVSKTKEENKRVNKIISISAIICFIGMLIWQIIDLVKYGRNEYKDGNGIELLKW